MFAAPPHMCYSEREVVDLTLNAEVRVVSHQVKCVVCSIPVEGYSPTACNVKCIRCRKTEPRRQKFPGPVEGKVVCAFCGKARKRLHQHLRGTHGVTPEEYLLAHPSALVEIPRKGHSKETRRKQADAASLRWQSEEERAAQSKRLQESNPWGGKKLSSEHREAISKGGAGVPRFISAARKKELGDQGRAVLIRERQKAGYRSRLSAGTRRRAAREGATFGFRDRATWEKGYQTRIANGTLPSRNAGRGITGFREGIAHYCRSTLEANFVRILLLEEIFYEYEPKLFKLASGKHYTPDFLLHSPLKSIPSGWVELKGWRHKDGRLPNGTEEKLQAFKDCTGEDIFVLTMHDPLWVALEQEETPKRNLRTHPDLFGRV